MGLEEVDRNGTLRQAPVCPAPYQCGPPSSPNPMIPPEQMLSPALLPLSAQQSFHHKYV